MTKDSIEATKPTTIEEIVEASLEKFDEEYNSFKLSDTVSALEWARHRKFLKRQLTQTLKDYGDAVRAEERKNFMSVSFPLFKSASKSQDELAKQLQAMIDAIPGGNNE